MRKMHVFTNPSHHIGGEIYYREEEIMRDPELREAYMCGRKDAYREIMEEKYGERHPEYPPMYRKDWDDYDDIHERRRRSPRTGRYI